MMVEQFADWSTGVYILVGAAALTIAVYWCLVPFAIFGIKALLRELITEQRRTNELLAQKPTSS